MQTTIDTLPTEYCPKTLEQFYGPARIVAQRLQRSAEMCLKRGAPAAHLLIGPSGSGKTSLAKWALASCFNVQPWCHVEIFGSDISVDRAREISKEMQGTNIFGGYRGWLLDEIDQCTKDARDRLLQIAGTGQARNTVLIATSNLGIKAFDAMEKSDEKKGRFTSRWQLHQVDCPTADDVTPLVGMWLPPKEAKEIAVMSATGSNGRPGPVNTRSLLMDLTTYLQNQL